ncbi:MAG: helix-turn-helix transcriptional regulator [Clostridia bacterium]|nr:helix-turn-helix transcriptional regulator [Clostridia bacterium]
MIDIGKQITILRRERDMTQEQLANLIGVSAQTVSKWECATTMPDILLLPILSEIFNISIDALFGLEPKNDTAALHTDKTEAAIDDLLLRMWCEGTPKKEANFQITQMRNILDNNRETQSMWLTSNASGIFVDKEIAVVNRMPRDIQMQALDRDQAVSFLSDCVKPNVMRMLQYMIENNSRAFTAATAASRCALSEEEATDALDTLWYYNFTRRETVELPDGTINVYRSFGEYKLLLLSAMFSLADKLADYKESYQGFSIS